jgi:hypothetical protein
MPSAGEPGDEHRVVITPFKALHMHLGRDMSTPQVASKDNAAAREPMLQAIRQRGGECGARYLQAVHEVGEGFGEVGPQRQRPPI